MDTSPSKFRIYYEIHKHSVYCHDSLVDLYNLGGHSIPPELTDPMLDLFKTLPKFSQNKKFQHFLKMYIYHYPTSWLLYNDILTTNNPLAFSKKSSDLSRQILNWAKVQKRDCSDHESAEYFNTRL